MVPAVTAAIGSLKGPLHGGANTAVMKMLIGSVENVEPWIDSDLKDKRKVVGFEPDMYTPIFAVARMVGWCAHVIEQLKDNRIMRPEANYQGPLGKKI